MAPNGGPERPNESAKEALLRRQEPAVRAWNILNAEQVRLEGEVAYLEAKTSRSQEETDEMNEMKGRIKAIAGEDDGRGGYTGKIDGRPSEKKFIEDQWQSEFKCPFKRWFKNIEPTAEDRRVEALIENTNGPEATEARSGREGVLVDFVTYTQANDNQILAAQRLYDAKLLPSDLKGGRRVAAAAHAVLPVYLWEGVPGGAPGFKERLKVPGSPAYNAAIAELSPYADSMQPAFDHITKFNVASRELEKGVAIGGLRDSISEITKSPRNMALAAGGLVAVALILRFGWKSMSDDQKKYAGVALGALGLAGGVAVFSNAKKNGVGAMDSIEDLLGMRADSLLSPEVLDEVRATLEAQMPTEDKDQIDDFIRLVDAPVEVAADAFDEALRNHKEDVNLSRFLGKGLSSKEYKDAKSGSTYQALKWTYMECYNQGIADGSIAQPETTDEAKLAKGVEWSRKEGRGYKMVSLLAALNFANLSSGPSTGPAGAPALSRTIGVDPKLAEFESRPEVVASGFSDALVPSGKPGIYLFIGEPFKGHFDNNGHFVLERAKPSTPPTTVKDELVVNKSLDGDELRKTLVRYTEEQTAHMRGKLAPMFGVNSAHLYYNKGGYWELNPGADRETHPGLPSYKRNQKIPVVIYADVDAKDYKVDFDTIHDEVVPMKAIADLTEKYEKEVIMPALVTDNISKTLLVPFTVESYSPVGTSAPATGPAGTTTVNIRYGTGTGTLIFSGDAISSYTLSTPIDATLQTAWTAKAAERCMGKDLLGDPRVQAALLRGTTEYTTMDVKGVVDKLVGLTTRGINWFKDDSIMNGFRNDWERGIVDKMRGLIYDPVNGLAAKYVNEVYGGTTAGSTPSVRPSNANFQGVENAFFNKYVGQIETGVVMATVTPEVLPDSIMTSQQVQEMLNTKGKEAIEKALAPLEYENPAISSSRFQAALQAGTNLVTGAGSSVRTEWYNKKVAEYQGRLQTAIAGYTVTPAGPVPAGAPALTATQPTRKQVEAEITRIQTAAQHYAVSYWGMTDKAAEKKLMMTSVIENAPNYAAWKDATGLVVDYMANNLKWESHAFMPNPENLALIMDQWHKHIGMAQNPPANAADAMTAAKNFIWEVWVRMGGNKDFSPDRLYNDTIESVSDSQFRANIAQLGTLPPYDPLVALNNRPPVPGMESDINKYKPVIQKQMEDWFAAQNDIKVWSRLRRWGPDMAQWKTVYEESFDKRMHNILTNANNSTSPTQLYNDMEDFKLFVAFEQRTIYDALINAGAVPETDHLGLAMSWPLFVETELIKDFEKVYFNPAPPGTRDLAGYKGYVIKNVARALDVHWHTPNMPGIPFVTF